MITAELKFLANLDHPLVYIPSRGGGDETEHQGNFASHEVEIRNARDKMPSTGLDAQGFRLVSQSTQVADFYDNAEIESVYHNEVTALLKSLIGAKRVEIFDDTRRASSRKVQTRRKVREPANIVHNDYTARSGIRRLRDHFVDQPEEAEHQLKRHFAIINVWRSIASTVTDYPLVICDATTVRPDDLVSMERRAEERIGELQVALYHPEQRWYYYPAMQMDEALVFKTFDSAEDGRTRFTLHSSCKDRTAPRDAPPRESIETRCLVFF